MPSLLLVVSFLEVLKACGNTATCHFFPPRSEEGHNEDQKADFIDRPWENSTAFLRSLASVLKHHLSIIRGKN